VTYSSRMIRMFRIDFSIPHPPHRKGPSVKVHSSGRVLARRRRRATTIATAVAACLGLTLTGCGASGNAGSTDSKAGLTSDQLTEIRAAADKYTEPPTEITQTEPLPGSVPTGKKVIFANSGIPATQLIMGGIQEAAEAIGWDFSQVSYDSSNPATIQSALKTALSKKPDVVIISGTPPTTYGESTIAEYKAAGVPLVVGSTCPLEVGDPIVAGAGGCDSETRSGAVLADWFIADSDGKGKVLFTNLKAIPVLQTFVDSFKAEVEAKCPDCTVDVLESTLEQIGQNQLVSSAVNKLRTDPSYGYLFFDNAQWAKGVQPALKAAGLTNIKVGGRSADEGAIGALQSDTQVVWTATPYNVNGYATMDAAIRAVMGTTEGAENDDVLPVQLLTPDNADSITVPYRYPDDALDSYLKLWGVQG
jgi:ribose transport system substrate-binding protein